MTLGSLLVPYPQYGAITQTNTNGRKHQDADARAARAAAVHATASASWWPTPATTRARQKWFDDIAQYKVLTSGGEEGWEWRPLTEHAPVPIPAPPHRRVTWQMPVGRGRAFLSDMPAALDAVLGGWQYTDRRAASTRAGRCSSPPATS